MLILKRFIAHIRKFTRQPCWYWGGSSPVFSSLQDMHDNIWEVHLSFSAVHKTTMLILKRFIAHIRKFTRQPCWYWGSSPVFSCSQDSHVDTEHGHFHKQPDLGVTSVHVSNYERLFLCCQFHSWDEMGLPSTKHFKIRPAIVLKSKFVPGSTSYKMLVPSFNGTET
jgi:hypothetical protein